MKKTLFSILFLTFSISCFSQSSFFDNYVYQSWSEFGGLSGTTANDIYQTSDGYINIGTYEGLVKFDGVEFHTLNRINDKDYGFASARVLCEDTHGNIWIGTDGGGIFLMRDEKIFSHITSADGIAGNVIFKITQDAKGNFWI